MKNKCTHLVSNVHTCVSSDLPQTRPFMSLLMTVIAQCSNIDNALMMHTRVWKCISLLTPSTVADPHGAKEPPFSTQLYSTTLLRVVYWEIAGLLSNHAMQQHTDTDSLPMRRSGSSLSGCRSTTDYTTGMWIHAQVWHDLAVSCGQVIRIQVSTHPMMKDGQYSHFPDISAYR